jgi:hypothetical protein
MTRGLSPRALIASAAALLALAATAGISSPDVPGLAAQQSTVEVNAAATATRAAELIELNQLRTQVAVLSTAVATLTPSVTATPTPTPTPVSAGQPLSYPDGWTVVVGDVSLLPAIGEFLPVGVFAQVGLTLTNSTDQARRFPFTDLRLRDEQGRIYFPVSEPQVMYDAGWFIYVEPSLPFSSPAIFDIATDAAGPFVLESVADAGFRVLVGSQSRG